MKVTPLVIVFSFICFFFLLGSCQVNNKEYEKEEIPLLVITDFGRDVDDAEAFIYLAKNPTVKVVGVICNGYIPEIRAEALSYFLKLMDYQVPIAVGSVFPMGIEDSLLIDQYFLEHSIDGLPYEVSLKDSLKHWSRNASIPNFETPEELITNLLKQYPNELRIIILSQATDVAEYFSSYPERINDIHSLYIQGQAQIVDSNRLLPDYAAYNLKEDIKATEFIFSLQDKVPFTLLGKYAAYPMAYTREEIESMVKGEDKVGQYFYDAANLGLECFLKRDSVTFYRVFTIDSSVSVEDAFQYTDKISNPYDLLTVIAITHPELFNAEKAGKHSLIGMSPCYPCFRDSLALKELLLDLLN